MIPNVTPYYRYDISLDSSTFADNVDIPLNNQTVYPTRNVVRAAYDTHKGYRVLLTLTRSNGEPCLWRDGKRRWAGCEPASIVGDKGQSSQRPAGRGPAAGELGSASPRITARISAKYERHSDGERRLPVRNTMKNLWMLLALSLFSGHALADGTMGTEAAGVNPPAARIISFFP